MEDAVFNRGAASVPRENGATLVAGRITADYTVCNCRAGLLAVDTAGSLGSITGDNAVVDGRAAPFAVDCAAKLSVAVCNSETIDECILVLAVEDVEGTMGVILCAVTIDDAVLRTVFGTNCNRFPFKVEVPVALAGVCAVGNENDIMVLGCIYACLNSGQILRWDV